MPSPEVETHKDNLQYKCEDIIRDSRVRTKNQRIQPYTKSHALVLRSTLERKCRHVSIRLNEHKSHLKNKIERSALAQHGTDTEYAIQFDKIKMLMKKKKKKILA